MLQTQGKIITPTATKFIEPSFSLLHHHHELSKTFKTPHNYSWWTSGYHIPPQKPQIYNYSRKSCIITRTEPTEYRVLSWKLENCKVTANIRIGSFLCSKWHWRLKRFCCRRFLRRDDSIARIGHKVTTTTAFLKLIILPLSYLYMRKCCTNSGPNHNPQIKATKLILKYGSSQTKFLPQTLKKVICCCTRLLRGDHLAPRIGNNKIWPNSPNLLLGHTKMLYKLRNRKNPKRKPQPHSKLQLQLSNQVNPSLFHHRHKFLITFNPNIFIM